MQQPKQLWRLIVIAAAIVLLAAMVIDFNGRVANLRRLTAQKEQVSVIRDSLLLTQSGIKEDILFATSEAAVKEYALGEGHMVRPGDVPVVPLQAVEITPTPFMLPQVTPSPVSNLDNWLVLFFGRSAP